MQVSISDMVVDLFLDPYRHVPCHLVLHRVEPVPELAAQLQKLFVPRSLEGIQAVQHIRRELFISRIRPADELLVELVKLRKEHSRVQMVYHLRDHPAYAAVIPGVSYVRLGDDGLVLAHKHRGKAQLIIVPRFRLQKLRRHRRCRRLPRLHHQLAHPLQVVRPQHHPVDAPVHLWRLWHRNRSHIPVDSKTPLYDSEPWPYAKPHPFPRQHLEAVPRLPQDAVAYDARDEHGQEVRGLRPVEYGHPLPVKACYLAVKEPIPQHAFMPPS